MNKLLHRIILTVALLLVPGCSSVLKALPTVIQYVQDAQMILDTIDRQAKPLLERFANEEIRMEYDRAMVTAQQTLQVALRSSKGTEELSKEQIDEAFANFREAYKNLLAVLRRAGVMSADGTMKTMPGVEPLTVPEPLAVTGGR